MTGVQTCALPICVLDGTGDFSTIKMPSGRAALFERMQAMLGHAKAAPINVLSPEDVLVEGLRTRHGERFVYAEMRADRLLMVLDGDAPLIAAERARLAVESPTGIPPVEMIDRAAWDMLQRFVQSGIMHFTSTPARILHRAGADPASPSAEAGARAA